MSDTLRYILIVVCILLSAAFSGSEIAFMQLNETKLKHEAEEKGSRLAKLALRFRERFDSGLIAILIGNNLVNIGSSSIAAALAISLMGEKGAWVATAIMTVLIITFGEILPKIFASERAEGVAKVMSLPLTAIWLVLFPLIWLLERFLKLLSGIWKEKESDDAVTEDDMETILDTVEDEGVVDEDTADLLQSAFDFDEVLAYEIITPRVDLVAIDIEDSREKQMKIAFASPFTRIPVYRDTPDHIVGILHLNHLYKAMVEDPDVPIQSLLMPVVYVHKTTPLPDVLDTMRRKKSHMVVDKIEEEFVEIGEHRYEVDGDMRLNDFLDEFDKEEEDLDDDNATVGGWAVEMLGGYPKLYDSFTYEDLTVTVLKKERMRILRLLVEQNPDWVDEDEEDDDDEE